MKKGELTLKKLVNSIKNYHPSKWEAFCFFIIPFLVGLLTSSGFDGDIWFLLNYGRYILNHGFPTVDFFTIHEGLHLVIQQWLTDIIFYQSYQLLGKVGIYLIVNFVNIYIIFITYQLLMLVTDKKRNLSVLFTVIITTLLSFSFIIARPQIFSLSFLLTELYVLEKYVKTKSIKMLWILPVLSILMINFHASMWLLLFCFLLPFFISTFKFRIGVLVSEGGRKKGFILIVILMLLVGIMNPYGLEAMSYIFTSYNVNSINELVNEMNIPDIHAIFGFLTYLCIFLVYISYIFISKKQIKIYHFCLLVGTSYLAISSNRGIAFFIIGSIYPLAFYLKDNFYYIKEPKNNSKIKRLFLFFICICVSFLTFIITHNQFILLKSSLQEGIDYINRNENKDEIRLYCNYGDCNYAEYLGMKVYIDSRAEVFLKANNHKEDIIEELFLLQHGFIYYKDFLDKYDFTHLLVKEDDILYQNLLNDDDYKIIYFGSEVKVDHKMKNVDKLLHYIIFKKKEITVK